MPDRLFASVADAWKLCTSALSEVKELIPEFFSCPAFLKNVNGYGFGSLQDGSTVVRDNCVSAPWNAGPKPHCDFFAYFCCIFLAKLHVEAHREI